MTDNVIEFVKQDSRIKKELESAVGTPQEKRAKILYEGVLNLISYLEKIENYSHRETRKLTNELYVQYLQKRRRETEKYFDEYIQTSPAYEEYIIKIDTSLAQNLVGWLYSEKQLTDLCSRARSIATIWNILHTYVVVGNYREEIEGARTEKVFYAIRLRGPKDLPFLNVYLELSKIRERIRYNKINILNDGAGIIHMNIRDFGQQGHSSIIVINFNEGKMDFRLYGLERESNSSNEDVQTEYLLNYAVKPIRKLGITNVEVRNSEKMGLFVIGQGMFNQKKGLNGLLSKFMYYFGFGYNVKTPDYKKCEGCRKKIPFRNKICPFCRNCASCGNPVREGAKFCPYCGESVK